MEPERYNFSDFLAARSKKTKFPVKNLCFQLSKPSFPYDYQLILIKISQISSKLQVFLAEILPICRILQHPGSAFVLQIKDATYPLRYLQLKNRLSIPKNPDYWCRRIFTFIPNHQIVSNVKPSSQIILQSKMYSAAKSKFKD